MKTKIILKFIVAISIILISCSESTTVNEPDNTKTLTGEISNYINKENVTYEYEVDTLNSISQNYETIGTRKLEIQGTENINDFQYLNLSEFYNLNGNQFNLTSLIRTTENSLIFGSDTTGVSTFIPDSLKETIKLEVDSELLIFKLPLEISEEWHVFKASVNFGAFRFKVFDVSAKYLGTEQIQIEGSSQTNAEKVEYTIELNIPDINNPFISNVKTVKATLWFCEGKGIVKMEGSAWLIKPLTGYPFTFTDQNTIMKHNLISEN